MFFLNTKSLLAATLIVISVLQGCSQHTKISEVTQDPARFRNKDVTISGKVTQAFGALGTGAYQLDDGTGKIWVISEQSGVPSQGANVEVTGRLIEGATFGTRTLGTALRESHRKS